MLHTLRNAWLPQRRRQDRSGPEPRWALRPRISAKTGRGILFLPRAGVLLAIGLIAPHVVNFYQGSYGSYILQLSTVYAIAVLGSNVLVGYLGEASLAQGVFMAFGAYICASFVAHGKPFLLGLLVALAVSAVVGCLLGNAVFTLRGAYAALATFSLAFALPDIIPHLNWITGGANGITLNDSVTVFGHPLESDSEQLSYILAGIFIVLALIVMALLHGRRGRALLAVSESRAAATAFRVRPRRVVVGAWILAGVLGTVGGALLVPVVGTVSPGQFTIYTSLYVFVGSIAGGARSVVGAWVGGFLAAGLPVLLADLRGGADVLVFGLILFVVVVIGPAGVIPAIEQLLVTGWIWVRRRIRRPKLTEPAVSPENQPEAVSVHSSSAT